MSLYGALSKHNHLSEFAEPLEVNGNLLTPTERRNTALQNLTGVSDIEAADFASFSVLSGFSEAEFQVLDGAVAANNVAGKALLASALMTAGTGVTAGVGFVYKSSVEKIGDLFITRIYIDLTGLQSADSDLDVIGVEDTVNPCHIGQITAAINGTIVAGTIQCLEAPASLTDIGIYSAGDGALVYENLITDESDEVVIVTPAVQAVTDGAVPIAGIPPANSYLYIVNGAADTPDPFTAGKLLLTLIGI